MKTQEDLSKEEREQRSAHAERLLADPLLKEGFANLLIDYFEAWMNSDPRDTAGRESIYFAARNAQHVEAHLRIVAASGRRLDAKHVDSMVQQRSVARHELRRSAPRPSDPKNDAKSDLAAL